MAIPSTVSNLEFIGRDAEAVAAELTEQLARTAVERDRRGGTPKHERDLLRASGLLSLSIPTAFGGMGGSYAQVMRVVRRIANADGSVAHVFGFQHLLLATVRLFGEASQWETRYAETAAQNLFWGNALNPLDPNTTLVTANGRLKIVGRKSFCSGALDSDRLVVSALRDSDSKLCVAVLPTERLRECPHIRFSKRRRDTSPFPPAAVRVSPKRNDRRMQDLQVPKARPVLRRLRRPRPERPLRTSRCPSRALHPASGTATFQAIVHCAAAQFIGGTAS